MSTRNSQYRGWVRDLQTLKNRCRVDPDTDCWLYIISPKRTTNRVTIRMHGSRINMSGRRAALVLSGVKIGKDEVAVAKACCHEPTCCNPAHSKRMYQGHFRSVKASKQVASPAVIAAASRLNPNRRPDWMVRWVIESSQPARHVAWAIGIDHKTANRWRAGIARKQAAMGVFSGLMT